MCIYVYFSQTIFLQGIMFLHTFAARNQLSIFDKVKLRKHLSYLLFHLIGLVFLISGVTKALDLKSFATLVAEFGDAFIGNWVVLLRTPIAISLCFIEITVGIISIFRRLTLLISITYFILIIVFLYLTACNLFAESVYRIENCGCFGHFIYLPPLQAFIKNIVLTILSIINLFIIIGSHHNH